MISNDIKYSKDTILNTATYIGFVKCGSYLYYSEYFYNGLFRINIQNRKIEFIGGFPNNENWRIGINVAVGSRDCILFFSIFGKNLYRFYPNNDKLECIENPFSDDDCSYLSSVRSGSEYIIIPDKLKYPILVYSEHNGLNTLDALNENILRIIGMENEVFVAPYGACNDEEYIYIALLCDNRILKCKRDSYKIEILTIGNAKLGSLTILDRNLWCVSLPDGNEKCAVYRYDLSTDTVRMYELSYIEQSHSCYCFEKYRDTLLAFEQEGDHIWIFDKNADEWKVFAYITEYPSEFHRVREGYPLFFGFHHEDGKLLLLPTGGNGTIEIDEATDEMTFYPSLIPDDFMEMRLNIERERKIHLLEQTLNASEGGLVFETSDTNIDALLGYVGSN